MHWIANYIGNPWKFGGDNLGDGLDCWGLFRQVQKDQFDLTLDTIDIGEYRVAGVLRNFDNNPEVSNWKKVDKPKNGDAVLMRTGKYPSHVGVWVQVDDEKGVLHSAETYGVIFSTTDKLPTMGWNIEGFYRHRSKV